MTRFFLFQRQTDPDWSAGKKAGFWIWNFGFVILAAIGIGLVSLRLALGPYSLEIFQGYRECLPILLLNLLVPVALMVLLYGLTGRSGASFLVTAVVILGLSAANYYKLTFRDDPMMFADLLLIKEAAGIAGNYHLFLNTRLTLTLVCVAVGWLFLHLCVRGRPKRRGRVIWSLAGVAAWAITIPLCLSSTIYDVHAVNYGHLDNQWSSTQQYISRGFIYPFVHSAGEAFEIPPEGYSTQAARTALAQFQDADIPEDQKVNILAVMLEAYNDFTKFGTPALSEDVYEVWHQLEAEGYSGNLVTNIFAGGTVDTERCFLTGLPTLSNFRSDTNSYVWYLETQGYTVEGMHPSADWFYNRKNINQYLGFSEYYFMENYFSDLTEWSTAGDDIFFPELLKRYREATAEGTPYFNFSVTYQGHGPYSGSEYYWPYSPDSLLLDGDQYTQEERYILANYFASIKNTNDNLKALTDSLREDPEPVVLVLFGDHNPWMGDGNSVYKAIGMDFDMSTQQGFLDYYSTRYIIWANDAAKAVLGSSFQGTGPDISPCFLMQQVFDLCGWTGPAYMQASRSVAAQVPVIHTTGQYLVDGTLTPELDPDKQALVSDYMNLQYYWRKHFAYGKE